MSGRAGALVPAVLVGAVLIMIMPIPAAMLDVFLAVNITIAIMALLGVVLLQDSLEFSVFPSLLLMATLLRLALNVSSTRLILLNGYAGKVIETFGQFVVGGSVIVGLVVFLILVVIQFVVVTNGAGRVAEVAARFTLDAMPGKQMAIDADLSAGVIGDEEARERRLRVAKESDFFGAMDGASKFVKGDAIAGIVIVLINLIGGFAIGEAIQTFSLLTVGDGLVSQIPALLISVATGLLVTRVGSDQDLGKLVGGQLFGNVRALRAGSVVTGLLVLVPGLPKIPFLILAVGLYVLSTRTISERLQVSATEGTTPTAADGGDGTAPTVTASADDPEALIAQMRIEPLELHLAYDILDLIDPSRGGDLLERVRSLRQQIALDVGIVMPYVRTRDDVSLPSATYRILLNGVEIARGTAPQDRALALPVGDGRDLQALNGTPTTEPVFNLPAYWIPLEARASAAATGATVVDRSSVIVTHLAEVVRANASKLLSRQQVQMLVEGMRYDEPLLANEITSDALPIGLVHSVLKQLLDERVPVRDLPRIAEALSEAGGPGLTVNDLAAAARVALGSAIIARIAPEGQLAVFTLEPGLEARFHEKLREVDGTVHLVLDPTELDGIRVDSEAAIRHAAQQPHPAALVVSQQLRGPLQRTLDSLGLQVPVLAYPELPGHLELHPTAVIGLAHVDA